MKTNKSIKKYPQRKAMGEQISMLLPTDSYLLNQSITACLPRKKKHLIYFAKVQLHLVHHHCPWLTRIRSQGSMTFQERVKRGSEALTRY
jgi:hypothetical protein